MASREHPVLLAVDQQFGEGAGLRVPPELADPVGPVEVGEHEDVEQLSAWSGGERVETLLQSALEFVGADVHPRILLRYCTGSTWKVSR